MPSPTDFASDIRTQYPLKLDAVNLKQAIENFLSAPAEGNVQFFSSLHKGLVDCRSATNRDMQTGEKLADKEHDSWVGALGYLALLDLIGTCLTKDGREPSALAQNNPFVHALEVFADLKKEEISALYALRCAFAHDFSLYNIHPTKPELTHYFNLLIDDDAPLVQSAKTTWPGDYKHRPPECATAIGLARIGDLVEGIYADLLRFARNGELAIRLEGGPEELYDRYSVMKNLKQT